jgi:hypothetical protein
VVVEWNLCEKIHLHLPYIDKVSTHVLLLQNLKNVGLGFWTYSFFQCSCVLRKDCNSCEGCGGLI